MNFDPNNPKHHEWVPKDWSGRFVCLKCGNIVHSIDYPSPIVRISIYDPNTFKIKKYNSCVKAVLESVHES